MTKTLISPYAVVTMDPRRRVLRGGAIVVRGRSIEQVLSREEVLALPPAEYERVDVPSLIAIPGFIQTHLHLCQTLFRGLADDLPLLDWLRLRIFPYEAAHTARSMYASASAGIAELIRSGTTTIMDMGSVHHEEEIIRAVQESGIRAYLGKCMMDRNTLYPRLQETTKESIRSTRDLAERWHGTGEDRVRYAVAPRFVLSCSETLLREAYALTESIAGVLFHTHASENRREVEQVRALCRMDNIEFFDSINVVHANTCLAHCIWLNDREINILAEREAKVLHCPSSNLKLGSGVARVPELHARGIPVSIGADGAPCNNTLDMFREMRLAALIQKPAHGAGEMTARQVFEMATLGGAAALGWLHQLGSIEAGKRADLVLLDVERAWNPYADLSDDGVYSTIVYSCSVSNVHSVMVDGAWLLRDGVLTGLDEEDVVRTARRELQQLLGRVQPA